MIGGVIVLYDLCDRNKVEVKCLRERLREPDMSEESIYLPEPSHGTFRDWIGNIDNLEEFFWL